MLENIVLGNLLFESSNNFSASLLAHFRLSSENPDVLLAEEGTKTDARVNYSVVVVVSSNNFVVASWGEWNEFDLEVGFVFAGIHDVSISFATTPLLSVGVVFVVENANVAVILQAVVSCVADAVLVGGVLVADDLVPLTEVVIEVEVLDNCRILAASGLDSCLGGCGNGNGRDDCVHKLRNCGSN